MSLKSKIEAVIYAAEEPVTPAQLAAIFGDEALAERQERQRTHAAIAEEADRSAHGQSVLMIEGEGLAPVPMIEAEPNADAATDAPESGSESTAPADTHPSAEADTPIPIVTGSETTPEATAPAESPAEASSDATTAVQDEKRLARQRDREIRDEIREIVAGLIAEYASSDRGMEIREVAGGYRVATKPEYHDSVRAFVKSLKPPMKLSLQALETLAVIAYKQPVTAPEVSEIRGVDSAGVLGSLLSRKLINTAGRKQVIGRPILYKTTKEFLLRFGLKDLNELPSMEEFEKMAGELNDIDGPVEADEAAPGLPLGEDAESGAEQAGNANEAEAADPIEANAAEPGLAVEGAHHFHGDPHAETDAAGDAPDGFAGEPAETRQAPETAQPQPPHTVGLDAAAPAPEETVPEDTDAVEVAAADHVGEPIAAPSGRTHEEQ